MSVPARLGVGSQARQSMTMRAYVQTSVSAGTDDWGHELADELPDVLPALACAAWQPTDVREVFDGDKQGVFGAVRLIVPADSTLREGDVIVSVTDRLERVLFDGPMRVTAVSRQAGALAVVARVARSRKGRA